LTSKDEREELSLLLSKCIFACLTLAPYFTPEKGLLRAKKRLIFSNLEIFSAYS
jgi:hypothetical protein